MKPKVKPRFRASMGRDYQRAARSSGEERSGPPSAEKAELRESGLAAVGAVPWGTHLCQFHRNAEELAEIVVPFLSAGLAANEMCRWVTGAPFDVGQATSSLRAVLPDLDRRLESGQLEIVESRRVEAGRSLRGWTDALERARLRGFDGLRLVDGVPCLEQGAWDEVTHHEESLDHVAGCHRMLVLCCYSLERCGVLEAVDVVARHRSALVKRQGCWEVMEQGVYGRNGRALRESEERLRALFERMTEGFALHEILVDDRGEPSDYRFLEVNPAFERLTGLDRAAVLGRTVREVLPSVEPRWIETYGRVALTGEPAHFEERSGALDRVYEVLAYSPRRGQFAVLFTDVTARRQIEAKLAWLASFPEQNPSPVVEVDLASRKVTYANAAALTRLPGLAERGLEHPWLDGVEEFPRSLEERGEASAFREIESGGTWSRQTFLLVPPGRSLRVYGTDITDRVRAEQAREVARAEEMAQRNLLEAVMEALPVGVAVVDAQGGSVRSNRAYDEIWRGPRPIPRSIDEYEAYRAWWLDSGEPVEPREWASARAVQDGETVVGQLMEIERFDGSHAFVHNSAAPIVDAHGQVTGCAVAMLDVTELEVKEREVERLHERLVRAQRSAGAGMWEWDLTTGHLEWSPELFELFGLDESASGASFEAWRGVVHPNDLADAEERIAEALRDRKRLESEYRIILPNGEERWVSALGDTTCDEQGTARRMSGICVDITARRRAEQALRESREDLSRAQAVARTGSWRLNVQSNQLLWSDETWRIFGIPRGTPLTYETFLGVVHPEDRGYVHEKWSATLRGEPYDIEHRIVVGDTVRWVRERAELEFDAAGTLLGGFGTTQDITERRLAEERVRAALKEKEILLKEIHHRVKNNLQIVASMLNLQMAAIQDEASRKVFLESQNRVRTLALIHEKLYGSDDFTNISFQTYAVELSSVVHGSFRETAPRARLDVDIEQVQLDVGIAIPLALVLNELLSNAFKHAFPSGQEGRVTVTLRTVSDGWCELAVTDDGVGVPEDVSLERAESIGFQLVTVLTRQLDGRLELHLDRGTRVVVSFPLADHPRTPRP